MEELLQQQLRRYNPNFSQEEIKRGLQFFEKVNVKAKEIVLNSGNISEYMFFSEKSISRCFYLDKDGEEQTLWIKPEQQFITEYQSFVSEEQSKFSIQFYEDSAVFRISRANLKQLYADHKNWALFGLHLTEALHVVLIDVFVNLLANDATRNYQYIEYAFPRFLKVAPLKDIASMLQISQVSLSRIRSGNQTKN